MTERISEQNGGDLSLLAVGDISPGDHYFTMGHGVPSRTLQGNMESAFRSIQPLFASADVLFGNLEGPLANSSLYKDNIERRVFRGELQFAQVLKAVGFDVLNIANNHIVQHGKDAFHETLTALESAEIQALGLLGQQEYHCTPLFKTVKGVRLGFLAYSWVPERYMPGQALYSSAALVAACEDIERIKPLVDYVVVSVHAGVEGTILPSPELIQSYRALVEAGVDIVLGHHSHVFQPVERYQQGLIFYSLGDFVFDIFWDELCLQSAVACIRLGLEEKSIDYDLVPVRFNTSYEVEKLDDKKAQKFHLKLKQASQTLNLEERAYQRVFSSSVYGLELKMGCKKFLYFLSRLAMGESCLKLRFLMRKFFRLMGMKYEN